MNSLAALVIVAAAALLPARAEAGVCYADWSIAAPIVRKEGLTTVETLARLARGKISGDIVKTTLCQESGGFVYRLVLRDAHGKLSNRTVDARMPFAR